MDVELVEMIDTQNPTFQAQPQHEDYVFEADNSVTYTIQGIELSRVTWVTAWVDKIIDKKSILTVILYSPLQTPEEPPYPWTKSTQIKYRLKRIV